jgi:hypothetical protein
MAVRFPAVNWVKTTHPPMARRGGERRLNGETLRVDALNELCRSRRHVRTRSKIRSKSFRHDVP